MKIDVRWGWGKIGLVFQQAGLQAQYVFAQLVVLVLYRLEVLLRIGEFFDLLLKFLDVAFLALAECALFAVSCASFGPHKNGAHLGSSVLGSSLAGGKFSFPFLSVWTHTVLHVLIIRHGVW